MYGRFVLAQTEALQARFDLATPPVAGAPAYAGNRTTGAGAALIAP
jgi:hypothetical protein